jgi:hypothetical protein
MCVPTFFLCSRVKLLCCCTVAAYFFEDELEVNKMERSDFEFNRITTKNFSGHKDEVCYFAIQFQLLNRKSEVFRAIWILRPA